MPVVETEYQNRPSAFLSRATMRAQRGSSATDACIELPVFDLENTGRKMHFTGTTVLKLKDGRIVEEIGVDDGVTALTQLGLLHAV